MRTASGLTWDQLRSLGHAIEEAADASAEQRRQGAQTGAALPDGSYLIHTQAHADKAAKMMGSGNAAKSTVIAHIRKRVRQLGLKMPAALMGAEERAMQECSNCGQQAPDSAEKCPNCGKMMPQPGKPA